MVLKIFHVAEIQLCDLVNNPLSVFSQLSVLTVIQLYLMFVRHSPSILFWFSQCINMASIDLQEKDCAYDVDSIN